MDGHASKCGRLTYPGRVIVLNAAPGVQAVLLVIAAVLAGVAALLGVVRQLWGEGWWRHFRPRATPSDDDEDSR